MRNSLKHIETLDYLRGIAIIGVLLFHTLGSTYGFDMLPWNGWLRGFSVPMSFIFLLPFSFGQAGVPIFFVVSGFCIHLSFQQQGQNWRSFFVRRFFRIYPAYFFALIFSALVVLAHVGLDFRSPLVWIQLASHLTLLHNVTPLTLDGFNSSFWSLAVEAQLYLLYPVLLVLVRKLGWQRTMFILAGCEGLIRAASGVAQMVNGTDTVGGNVCWVLANSPLGYWFSWTLGARIAEAFQQGQPLPFAKLSPVAWLALAVASYFVKPLATFQFLLFAVVAAAAMSRLLSGTSPGVKLPGALLAGLKKIGLWSYSLYLLHQPVLQIGSYLIVGILPPALLSGLVPYLLTSMVWLVIIPFSALWYKTIELPAIAWGKRLIQNSAPRKTPIRAPATGKQPAIQGLTREARLFSGSYVLMLAAAAVIAAACLLGSYHFSPRAADKNNNLAWSLATSASAAERNGPLAVKLAESACRQTQYKQTVMIGTLAAAYAEAGRFDDAVAAAQQACALARSAGDEKLLQRNQELLEVYLRREAYHEGQ